MEDKTPNPPENDSKDDQNTDAEPSKDQNILSIQQDFNPIQIANQIVESITKNDSENEENENQLEGGGTSPNNQDNNENQNMAPGEDNEKNSQEETKIDNDKASQDQNSDSDSKVDLNDTTKKIEEVLITGFGQPRVNSDTINNKKVSSSRNNDNQNEEEQEKEDEKDNKENESETDDLEQEVDKVLKSNSASQVQSKNRLLSYVRKCQIDKMLETDYDSANRYRICETIIQNQIYFDEHLINNESRNQTIDRRIENLKKNRERIEKEWDDRFESFKQEADERQKKLEECHRKELEEFEQRWGSEDYMSQFSKASPSLLQLRQRQKIQALSKDFTGAKQTKELADQLQKQEEIENEKIAILTMKKQYAQMIEKQRNESECAKENWERHKKFLLDEKERKLKQIDRTTQQLETRKAQPIVTTTQCRPIVTPVIRSRSITSKSSNNAIPSYNRTNRPTTTTATTKSMNSNQNRSSYSSLSNMNNTNSQDNNNSNANDDDYTKMKTSPRTRKTLVEYRNKPNDTKLNIPVINVSQQIHGTVKSPKQSFKPRMTKRYRSYA